MKWERGSSSRGSGLFRRDESRVLGVTAEEDLVWERFSKCERSEETGLRGALSVLSLSLFPSMATTGSVRRLRGHMLCLRSGITVVGVLVVSSGSRITRPA